MRANTLAGLRMSAGYAAARFEALAGASALDPCAELLADAIEHVIAVDGAWSITLEPSRVMLNAGPVRVFNLSEGTAWVPCAGDLGPVPEWARELDEEGVIYKSVPPNARGFVLPTEAVARMPAGMRAGFLAYVSEAGRRRRGTSLWVGSHSPGVVAFLNEVLGRQIGAPLGAQVSGTADDAEIPSDGPFLEGRSVTLVLDVHERDPRVRAACIAALGVRCTVCGLSFEEAYGPIGAGFIEVHHLAPLATASGVRRVDPVSDLVPVCPNCHRMIHRRNPPLTTAELLELRVGVAGQSARSRATEG